MKKITRFLPVLSLIASGMLMNVENMPGGMLLVQAAEENEIIFAEGDSTDNFSDSDESNPVEEPSTGPAESGTEEKDEDEVPMLELYIDEFAFSVPWENVNRIEEEELLLPKSYENRYVLHFIPKEKAKYVLHFSTNVAQEDVWYYDYDAYFGKVNERIAGDGIIMAEDGSIVMDMDLTSEYIIVVDQAEKYPEIELCISRAGEGTESGSGTETGEETEPGSGTETGEETEPGSGTETGEETEPGSGTETGEETEPGSGTETGEETGSETEKTPDEGTDEDSETTVTLVSAELLQDEGLETVPASLLSHLDEQDIVKVRLHYSDGTEQILTGGTDSYGNYCELTYEDTAGEDGSVSRTYTLKVIPAQEENGTVPEQSATIVFLPDASGEVEQIRAEEKTRIQFSRKKNWVLVQSVPKVTGIYSMDSFGRTVKEIYYCAEGETGTVKAGSVFELTKEVTYTFLLKLEE